MRSSRMSRTRYQLKMEYGMRWKDVEGYAGSYQISDKGQVMSFQRNPLGRLLKPCKTPNGYLTAHLSTKGEGRTKITGIHRLVAQAFLGPPTVEEIQVNHKDGDKTNNHVSNLEWCSQSGNMTHRYDVLKKPQPTGEKNKHSKTYEVTYPDGRKITVVGLRAFCAKENLCYAVMSRVSRGERKSHKKFTVKQHSGETDDL